MSRLVFALTLFMSNGQARQMSASIDRAATRYGMDKYLVAAVIHTESRFKSNLCYHGAFGYMQIQLPGRSCGKQATLRARWFNLENADTNIDRGVRLMRTWKKWCKKHHSHLKGKKRHHWLLHYNQGFGVCPKKGCQKEDRIPVTSGHIGGYADRVLRTYYMLKERSLRAQSS